MVLQKGDSSGIVKSMLAETLLALCKNVLTYEGEFSIEGLLGITLDNKEIFLININETVQKEGYLLSPSKKRQREANSDEENESSTQDSDTDSSNQSKGKKKRRRKRKEKICKDKNEEPINNDHEKDDNESDNSSKQSRVKLEENIELKDNITRPNTETSFQVESDDEIMFVKEEPVEDSSYLNYGQSFPQPFTSQNFGVGGGELQEMSAHFPADMGLPGPSNMASSSSSPSSFPLPGTTSSNSSSINQERRLEILLSRDQSRFQTIRDDRKGVHVCSLCSKVFPFKSHLERHMRIHTGEKPFKCTICDKSFTQKNNLKSHQLSHQNDQRFDVSEMNADPVRTLSYQFSASSTAQRSTDSPIPLEKSTNL